MLTVLRIITQEAALRYLRNKLRLAQVLVALLTTLACAIPDLRGVHGYRSGEVAIFEPAERQVTQENATLIARTLEDAEEFFGDGAPAGRIKGVRLALTDGSYLLRGAQSWTQSRRLACAHLPTGPPTA
ncbi:MAG: hypothetical protein Q8M31_13685 [Beijerinckiaceae bacterium]|nr:hypothetical protein [Beijerinckiaceae bacterium]